MLARRLREELEEIIGPEYEELVVLLGQMRCIIQERVSDPEIRRKIVEDILPPGVLSDLNEERINGIKKRVKECIS